MFTKRQEKLERARLARLSVARGKKRKDHRTRVLKLKKKKGEFKYTRNYSYESYPKAKSAHQWACINLEGMEGQRDFSRSFQIRQVIPHLDSGSRFWIKISPTLYKSNLGRGDRFKCFKSDPKGTWFMFSTSVSIQQAWASATRLKGNPTPASAGGEWTHWRPTSLTRSIGICKWISRWWEKDDSETYVDYYLNITSNLLPQSIKLENSKEPKLVKCG